jgi:lipoate-protein ligase A
VAADRGVNGPERRWRLLLDGRCPAAWNMAVDRAIQIARDQGRVPPTLRLYGWQNPTVTLGKFQDAGTVDLARCHALGVDVVRRFTGGRGVLHDDEVTDSVIASTEDGIPRGTTASYRTLSAALAATYRALEIGADLVPREAGVKGSAACYLHSTSADLSLEGRKLSGSAQVWLHDTVLQHGSFVITRDIEREAAVFGLDPQATRLLAETTATIGDDLRRTPSAEQIAEATISSFEEVLGVTLEAGALTSGERRIAERLVDEVTVRETV